MPMALKGSIRVDAFVYAFGKKLTMREFENRVKAATKSMGDFSTVHANIATLLDQWVQLNFRGEGSKVGGWKDFKAGGRWVSIAGGGRYFDASAKLLQDTGALRASYRPFHSKVNAGIGSDLPYAKPHDRGTSRLPKRRMLPEQGEVETDVRAAFEFHVKKELGL